MGLRVWNCVRGGTSKFLKRVGSGSVTFLVLAEVFVPPAGAVGGEFLLRTIGTAIIVFIDLGLFGCVGNIGQHLDD